MAKFYKVWMQVEELDTEDADYFENVTEPIEAGIFQSREWAEKFMEFVNHERTRDDFLTEMKAMLYRQEEDAGTFEWMPIFLDEIARGEYETYLED